MPTRPELQQLIHRETIVSAIVNAIMSVAIFAVFFGLASRSLAVGRMDGLAIDFLPQGFMVSFMGSLVPSLIMQAKLRKAGMQAVAPSSRRIASVVAIAVAVGLASAVTLMVLASFGPLRVVHSYQALAFKMTYGAILGFVSARFALRALYLRSFQEESA